MRTKNNEGLVLVSSLVVTILLLGIGGTLVLRSGMGKHLSTPPPSSRYSSTAHHPNAKVTLSVLGDTFSGYSTLRANTFQSALIERGVGVKYDDEFNQLTRARAINNGKADIIVTSLDQFLRHKPQGKIVGLIDRTVGADAVVLNTRRFPQLKSLGDLEKLVSQRRHQGQTTKIVFAGDTPSEFLAMVLDTSFDNFNLADLEIATVADASLATQKLKDDANVAVAILWEPFVHQAKQQGNTVVLSSADVPKTIVDVIVASQPIMNSQPKAVQAFIETYYQRIDATLQDPNQLVRQIALDGKLTQSEAKAVNRGIQFFTSVEAQEWMKSGQLDQRIKSISSILALAGKGTPVTDNPQSLYSAIYLSPVAKRTKTLMQAIAIDNPELAKRLRRRSTAPVPQPKTVAINQAPAVGHLKVRGEVKFQTGSAELTGDSAATLQQLAQQIREFSPNTIGIQIQGHTSRTGTAALNQKLSAQRAAAVERYLQTQQVNHYLTSEGLGYSKPLPGSDPASPLNQRTVIRLVRIGGA
ncbi:OmpA family protein [filamentous cyanobacterium LEGE 11480]|uniref:OmpA family protein n=1 Tax=Romeriopsis navalis LEGE 11480 TaxID=2777977 RepID=A0A928Z496_9CYAN|nr:phosphate ABC transporter substrate-binding/OmpA family protein [Romeriopsis navalis]MBE9030035.1 OmpA family protein [Romeriopsis navalis LEGE 11480]